MSGIIPTILVGGGRGSGPLSSGGPHQQVSLPGCRSSLITSQSITTFGSPGLDQILGGGIPVGSVLVFEENPTSLHSQRFLHVFAAEGLALGQKIAVATPPSMASLSDFVSCIPCKKTALKGREDDAQAEFLGKKSTSSADQESLRIAWRYENNAKVDSAIGQASSLVAEPEYDLGKRLAPSDASGVSSFTPASDGMIAHSSLMTWLLRESSAAGPKNLLRIALPSLDSPLWGFHDIHDFCSFLLQLRSLVRHSNTIVCMTLSRELHDSADLHRIRRLSDGYIALETFNDTALRSALYKDLQSICRLQKSFSINALRSPQSVDHEFGLKIKKRRITFERLHLPPALQDTTQRETSDGSRPSTHRSGGLNCQTASEKGLDF